MSEDTAPTDGREPAAMSVRGAAAWAMAGQYLSFAMQFATSVVISRFFLTPAEVGLFSIALAAALLVAILQDFGLSRYISGLAVLDGREVARCSSVALLFSLVVVAVIWALAWPMAHIYAQPALTPILLIIGASYFFLPLTVVPMALMARAMQFRGHFAINVGGAFTQGAVAVALAAAGESSFALAWATVASAASRGIIAQFLRPALPWPLRVDGARPVLSFGARSSVLYLTGALGTRSPDLILGKLLNLAAVGFYSRAASLSDQFRTLISGAIGSVFFPAFARIRDRGEPLGPAYLRVCAGYSAVIWPGMAGLALAADPLVRILYGEAWMRTAPLLTMISLTEIMLIALPLVSDLPILLGRLNRLLAFNIADTVLSIALLAFGCLWGLEGAAASRLVYGALWLGLYARFIHGLVRFDVRALLHIYARSAAATLAAIAPLTLCYLFWTPPAQLGFAMLLATTIAGVAAWLATLFLLRHPALDDLLGLASSLPFARTVANRLQAAR
ncbi:oligosaccharide flippase family protein [Novosphingobium sp.]|uniref:oligosaccharide flippase family protein n=1 Tax=Novosphingobium sp. TaxID=1874826 RepID=UPI0017F2E65E|nr:oligosaccharide flippase family protein [Novosphingobium sp.]